MSPDRPSRLAARPWVLIASWAGSVAVVAAFVDHFWIPLDDGTLAQSAERVLRGELPHRDFGDPYTGLGAWVGAAAFRLFGVSLASLRVPLVIGFAVWLPSVWIVARRLASPAVALGGTLFAACLSVLAYPAAMPTWFGLFAVGWGLVFLVRALETDDRRWLAAAGACAGVSFLFKLSGLYFLAAVWLSSAFRRAAGARTGVRGPAGSVRLWTALGGISFLVVLGRLVMPGARLSTLVHFFLPSLALVAAILARSGADRPEAGGGAGGRPGAAGPAAALLRDVGAAGAGFVAPILVFLLPWILSGALGAWVEGVFVAPGRRFGVASSGPGGPWTLVPGLVAVGLVATSEALEPLGRRWLAWGVAAALTVGFALDDYLGGAVVEWFWYSARGWLPMLVVWGAWRRVGDGEPTRFAVLATAALWSLVQFPYSAPAYFFYVAPLVVLATLATVHTRGRGTRPLLAIVAALYLFLGAGYVTGVVLSGELRYDDARAGIRISGADRFVYGPLVDAVDRRLAAASATGGPGSLWVTPDAPEVYFLTGRPNPGPVLYEFLTPDPVEAESRIRDAGVVVLNRRPLFSDTVSSALRSALAREGFRLDQVIGRFEVHSRKPPP